MYCYILSSRLFTKKLYKFGKTVLVREELIKCYRRYIPDVEILEYYPSSNHHKDETRVLTKFREYRYVNHDGHVTEWLDIEFSKLKSHCDKFFKKSIAKLAKKELVKKIDVEKELSELDSSGYDISLEKACYILNKNDTYEKYMSDSDFRGNFNTRYLRNKKFFMKETKDENNLECDFIMKKDKNISYPWFTLNGFKNFCAMFRCEESNIVKNYYEKLEYQNKIDQTSFKKEDGYLIPIDNDIELVNRIIKEYNPEMEVEIVVYGNENEPLFIPSQIRDIIYVDITTFKRRMNDITENIDFILSDYIEKYNIKNSLRERKQNNKRLLTKYGLYKILVKTDKNIPKKFMI